MPTVNFGDIEEAQEYTLIPDGEYLCIIEKVEEKTTRNGDDMWKLTLSIIDGEFKNRKVFTNLVFTEKGYGNVKKLYKEIGGFNLAKSHNCQPNDLLEEKIICTIKTQDYTNDNGIKTKTNTVAYGGFRSISENEW